MNDMKKRMMSVTGIVIAAAVVLLGAFRAKLGEGEESDMRTDFYFHGDESGMSFQNDLGIREIGDPYVLKAEDGAYYMYCTSAPNGFYCWRSEDMVHWGDKKMCYVRKADAWCTDCFWAPEVYCYNGEYYMFYTAKNQENSLRIGLAVASRPDGPFEDLKNEPFLDPGYAVIDANVLFDEDGHKYLYYARDCSENVTGYLRKSEIYGVQLSDDLRFVAGEPVKLTTPEQAWEKASGDTQWNEGPEVIRHQDVYYLTYSANYFESPSYSIGYATSDSPLGPFVKAEENPILTSGTRKDVSGPGHHSFTVSPDGTQLWAFYHSHSNPLAPSGDRKVNMDRAGFTEDGKLFINGPVTACQPLPSGNTVADVTGRFRAQDARLTDGFISTYRRQAERDAVLEADENGCVRALLEADEAAALSGAAVYPAAGCLEDCKSVRLCLDGISYSEEYLIGEDAASPLLLSFDTRMAKRVEVILTLKEGITSTRLSEIALLQFVE